MKLAIVGCGDIGYHVARLSRLNRKIWVVACIDRRSDRARLVARKAGCDTIYTDMDELPGMPGASDRAHPSTSIPDALYLGVPHDLHLPLVRSAVGAGYAVLCEKPLAHTLEDAREIVALYAQGYRIGINYQYRYDHGCYTLIRAAGDGALGTIRYIRCNIPWLRDADYFGGDGWHATRSRAGGGTLITQGSHLLDIALRCSGGNVVTATGRAHTRVFTDTDIDDLFIGTVETSPGVSIEIVSSMIAVPERPATIEVYGSRGTAVYTASARSPVHFYGVRYPRRRHPVRFFHPLGRSLEGFRRWVDGTGTYECTASDALPVMEAVSLLYTSAGVLS